MLFFEMSPERLESLRLESLMHNEQLGLEADALFKFTDGNGTGYIIEHRKEQGYRYLRYIQNRVLQSSGWTALLEDTLEAAVGDLQTWLELAQGHGDWIRSLRTATQELRLIVERFKAEAEEWPIHSLTAPVDSSHPFT